MRNPCTGRNAAWIAAGLALVAIMTPQAPAAERVVLGESFTATW
jgi:hypothetical protein